MKQFSPNKLVFFLLLIGLSTAAFAQSAYNRADLWEKEIAAFAAADHKEFPGENKVLFVGSSSIRGWRTLNEDFPGVETINRGFGGSHLEDVIHYAPQIVFPYRPKLIVLYAGENDIAAGKSVAAVFQDFKRFAALVRRQLPKTGLIVISAKPSPSRADFAPKFKEFNALMAKEIAAEKRSIYVDVWTPMTFDGDEPKKDIFLADKLHMNAEGYKIWRETLAPYIKAGSNGSFKVLKKAAKSSD